MSRGRVKVLISTHSRGTGPRYFGAPRIVDITAGLADLRGFSWVDGDHSPSAQLIFYDPHCPVELRVGSRGDLVFFYDGIKGGREIWSYQVEDVQPVPGTRWTEAAKHTVDLTITDAPQSV